MAKPTKQRLEHERRTLLRMTRTLASGQDKAPDIIIKAEHRIAELDAMLERGDYAKRFTRREAASR